MSGKSVFVLSSSKSCKKGGRNVECKGCLTVVGKDASGKRLETGGALVKVPFRDSVTICQDSHRSSPAFSHSDLRRNAVRCALDRLVYIFSLLECGSYKTGSASSCSSARLLRPAPAFRPLFAPLVEQLLLLQCCTEAVRSDRRAAFEAVVAAASHCWQLAVDRAALGARCGRAPASFLFVTKVRAVDAPACCFATLLSHRSQTGCNSRVPPLALGPLKLRRLEETEQVLIILPLAERE